MALHFSDRLEWPSPENRLALALASRRSQGLPILNWVESNPTRVGLERSSEPLLAELCHQSSLRYSPDPRGLAETRSALARWLALPGKCPAPRPEDLFLCASTSEAYGLLFKLLCSPGDAVLVPKPGYPLFDYLAGLEAVEARSYRLSYAHPSGWSVDLESLEAGLAQGRAKAIVLINPNNPTGSYVGHEQRQAILALAERYEAALIVDEVFFGFPLEARGEASFLGEARVTTFVLDGLSKMLGLPQMKLGWIALSGPGPEVAEAEARLEIISDTYLSASTPIMNALPGWLGLAEEFRATLARRLGANLATLRATLEGGDSPHRVLRCEGGWTALIESPRLAEEEDLALDLLAEEGLYLHPGFLFDMEGEGHFAVSLLVEPGDFAQGAARYRAFFDRRLA